MVVLLLLHVTVLTVAFAGATVAVSCAVEPIVSSVLAGVTVTVSTSIGLTETFTEPETELLSVEVAVMVTVPGFAVAVTLPSASTVATVVSLLPHVKPVCVVFEGVSMALATEEPLTNISVGEAVRDMDSTGMTTSTSEGEEGVPANPLSEKLN